MGALRIAIVDDHPMICDGIATMLQSWPNGQVVLKAMNGVEYANAVQAIGHVDIALIDVCMPVRDGFSTLEWMRTNQQRTLPVMLTFDPTPEVVSKVVRLGARGVLGKNIDREELHLALDHVSTTGYYMNALMTMHLHGADTSSGLVLEPPGRDKVMSCLTKRELEVIEHICAHDDPTYPMVAERMGLSENTVHTHRARIFNKLGVSNRLGLLRAAMNWRLLKRSRH